MNLILDLSNVHTKLLDMGLTQSELSTKDACAMKWNLRYNNLVTKRGAWNWNTAVGDAFHSWADERYSGRDADPTKVRWQTIHEDVDRGNDFEELLEYWTAVIIGMQQGYERHYKFEETEFEILAAERTEHRRIYSDEWSFLLQGKIDLRAIRLALTKHFMMDHKSTSRPDLMAPEGWDMRFQFMFYSWLVEPLMPRDVEVFDFAINCIRKPALRPTKGELQAQFAKRCKLDYLKRGEFYFLRNFVPISKSRINRFESHVLRPKLDLLHLAMTDSDHPSILNMNTNSCHAYNSVCEFLPYCRNGNVELFQFMRRNVKHVELEGAE